MSISVKVNSEEITLSQQAAEHLFFQGSSDPLYEPRSYVEACAAVQRFGELFGQLPRNISNALESALESGDSISSDRLQGLAEIVQNADDAEASEVRLQLVPKGLLVGHNGHPVRLRDAMALATPWGSTKGDESHTIGRFGIGLTTLKSLSDTLEVHCPPYHMRLGDPVLSPIEPPDFPTGLDQSGWTVFCIPLDEGGIGPSRVDEWLERWSDSALLFLSHVRSINWLDKDGRVTRRLAISRQANRNMPKKFSGDRTIMRQLVVAGTGQRWMVYRESVAAPRGALRSRKKTAEFTPVAIALPLHPVDAGQIHAGLPVALTRLPLFANAQFDPLTSRQGFPETPWNEALVPLVAELWLRAALDLFSTDPKAAWQAMPSGTQHHGDSGLVRRLEEEVISGSRNWLPSRLSFYVRGVGPVGLAQLAVEAKPLERILTLTETACLARLPAALPIAVRDSAGRWREVLDDWRRAGAGLPEPIGVNRALELFDGSPRRVESTIKLVAAGLREKLEERLLQLPCVATDDRRHWVPARRDSLHAFAIRPPTLANQLGLVRRLHSAYGGRGASARTVFKWLSERGSLLIEEDDRDFVRRLSAAGHAQHRMSEPLTDDQLQALRNVFELLDRTEQQKLGPGVGKAVLFEAYEFEASGSRRRPKAFSALAGNSYLPKAIDRETDCFQTAAGSAVGITWLSKRYASVLKSSKGREGIGAMRFLRLLGAESAPRPVPHPQLHRRFQNEDRGLGIDVQNGPIARREEMRRLDATYTLSDSACPELVAAAVDIETVRRGGARRTRAGALLATLSRAWERLQDSTEVPCASDYFTWQHKGYLSAYWLWQIRDIAWLDDETGKPRKPSDLCVRSPGTEALYGIEPAVFLHPSLARAARQEVLNALGMSNQPTRSELVEQLVHLRSLEESGEGSASDVEHDTAMIYKALDESLRRGTSDSDLRPNQLRERFKSGRGLLYTNLGWQRPLDVLKGDPIFGDYKAFAPAIGAERLWTELRLGRPTTMDCIEVVRALARKKAPPKGTEEPILLETLRKLIAEASPPVDADVRRKLANLPLWTSQGWKRERPVYATDNPLIAHELGERLSIWSPGGTLSQFRSLLDELRVQEIRSEDADVVEANAAYEDSELTDYFQSAVLHLRDDLARNAPQLSESLRISWDDLLRFSVSAHPALALRVSVALTDDRTFYDCEVSAHVDRDQETVFVKGSRRDLMSVESGGRALATLFNGDQRQLAQAWLAACVQADGSHEANPLELARERRETEQKKLSSQIDKRTRHFQLEIDSKPRKRAPSSASSGKLAARANAAGSMEKTGPSAMDLGKPRELVDVDSLSLVDPRGQVSGGNTGSQGHSSRRGHLIEPREHTVHARNKSRLRAYSDLEKETLGLKLLRRALRSDREELKDLRTQAGVGADAMDELSRFYELKVHSGSPPNEVKLTGAEVKRALSTPDFFLVIVSDVEGEDARPTVQFILDPLKQLAPTDHGDITLSGVHNAKSLTFHFVPDDV